MDILECLKLNYVSILVNKECILFYPIGWELKSEEEFQLKKDN